MNHVVMTEDLMKFAMFPLPQQHPGKQLSLNPVSHSKQSKIVPQSSSKGSIVGNNAFNQGNLERRPNNPSNSVSIPSLISFKCLFCSLFFRTQAFLNEHMRKEHSVLI